MLNLPERTDRRDAITLAAAVSDIDITFIDGVKGSDVSSKVLPADSFDKVISRGNKGSWRAHMNALQTCVPTTYLTLFFFSQVSLPWGALFDLKIPSTYFLFQMPLVFWAS